MNEHGKSDRLVVPKKSPIKDGQPAAEEMEGRDLAKGNLSQQNAFRTQGRVDAPSAPSLAAEGWQRGERKQLWPIFISFFPTLTSVC